MRFSAHAYTAAHELSNFIVSSETVLHCCATLQ